MRDCVTSNFYFYNPSVSLRLPPPLTQGRLLVKLVFQPQIIGYHRNKLAIRGFSSIILDSVAEIRIEGIFAFTFREKYAIL